MRKLFLFLLIFGMARICQASFKEQRDTVGKSSFTDVTEINVAISTAPSFVRSITFSGVDPCTVTIYNAQLFNVTVTTRARVYWPGNTATPITVNVDTINSSGTLTHKIGVCAACYNWDWYTKPSYINPLNEGN